MTTPIFKLTKGVRYIDLQAGRYRVHQGWAPPSAAILPLLAEGTSANRNGATLAGRRPVTRSFSLRVNVTGSTDAEIRRGVNDIDAMLALAGDDLEPLYLEFKPNSDTLEPMWGNYGVNLCYEIVSGSVEIEKSYLTGARLANDVDVIISITVKPYAVGKPQLLCSATGGVREDVIGSSDGSSRGLVVAEATPTGGNQFGNPVFGYNTWNGGWSAGVNVNAAQNTDPTYILFGRSSARLTAFSSSSATYTQSINLGSTSTHTVSAYVKKRDGSVVTTADAKMYYAGDQTTSVLSVGDGWYRLSASFTGIASAQNVGISLQAAGVELFADMFQVELGTYATPPCYGDMLGCAWGGTAHSSTSSRTAARIRLPVSAAWSQGGCTIRMAVRFDVSNTHPNNMVLWSRTGAATVYAQFNATGDTFQLTDATTMVARTTPNLAYREAYERLGKSIVKGEPISRALLANPALFPDILAHMVSVGETTGNLSNTFTYLSELYEAEVEEQTKNLSQAIEPILMVIMGVLVGFIAVSIITPIYAITQNLQT
jgi:alpha-D-ribose 1-methylphosphonate 5-triphosphate synthase subunit PhnG